MPQIRIFLPDDNEVVHELSEETATIGRQPDNTIQIEDASVSSHHAEIVFQDGQYQLQDKGSTNGTFLNGAPASDAVLKDGDQVRFGSVETIFAGDVPLGTNHQPLPRAERSAVSAGGASARPTTFVNASPFPRPKPKTDALTYAAIALGVLGAVGFVASVALSLTLKSPL
jgi:pSer/pThr/pTyr-binding forkhead associated (FHA) protein